MKSNFTIDANFPRESTDAITLVVPKSVSSKDELMDILAHGLNFPDYFGRNWDALDECLNDFSWLKKKRVIIVHNDVLEKLLPKDLKIYLEVLRDAVANWRDKPGDHELIVVFPKEPKMPS